LSTLSGWLPRRGATAARGRTASNYRRTVRSPIRCQPPVYSPISWDAARRAAMQGLGWRDDPCPRVERLVRALYRAQETVLLGSGTQALELAIRVATRVAGEQCAVALPAFSCYDVATAAVGARMRIALYDVDPGTLGPDLDSLAAALASGARIVVAAPLWGTPVDWGAVERCAAPFGAVVIGGGPLSSRARRLISPLAARAGFLRLPLRLSGGLAGFSDPRSALRLGVAPGYPATLATLRAVRERLTGRHGPWPGAQDLVRE